MIYFARPLGRQLVKIGVSNNVDRRLSELYSLYGVQFEILGVCDGSRTRELALHKQFAFCHHIAEWFLPAPALLKFISETTSPFLQVRKLRARRVSPSCTIPEAHQSEFQCSVCGKFKKPAEFRQGFICEECHATARISGILKSRRVNDHKKQVYSERYGK